MSRCAIYARFSSDRQKDTSIDDQFSDCRRYAAREGWEIVGEFGDLAISGADIRRPQLTAMLAHVAAGRIDTILVEDQDRLARDQEDIAAIFKRITYAGARIVTISGGEVNELHIGLKGTMDALELKKIREKVKRGMRGAIARGHVPGGRCYGYDVVRELDAKGDLIRGLRKVNEAEAAIIRRVFEELASGRSAKTICRDLNRDGVPGPSGREWTVGSILGSRARKTGMLHNPIYLGRIVYNRASWRRHPETRKRIARVNPETEHDHAEAPELRIVPDDLWRRAQAELSIRAGVPLGERTRPKHLLSGLLECGTCGGGIVIVSTDKLGCSRRYRGGTCANNRTIGLHILQGRVLGGLEEQLLSDEAVALLVRDYHASRAKRLRESAGTRASAERRLAELQKSIDRLVAAIADGGASFGDIREQLTQKTAERDRLQAETAEAEALPVIALHPRIADVYRERVRALIAGLRAGEITAASPAGQIRALVDTVTLTPRAQARGYDIEITCSLEAAVTLAGGGKSRRGSESTAVSVAVHRIHSASTREMWKNKGHKAPLASPDWHSPYHCPRACL